MAIPASIKRFIRYFFERDDILATGTPAATDLIPFVAITEAVARVVTGTYSDAATADSVVTLGGLVLTEGVDFEAGADEIESATNLVAAVADEDDIAEGAAIVDNADGSFTITFAAGVAANIVALTSDDENLEFVQGTAGANEYRTMKAVTLTNLAGAVDDILNP